MAVSGASHLCAEGGAGQGHLLNESTAAGGAPWRRGNRDVGRAPRKLAFATKQSLCRHVEAWLAE